MKKSFRRFVATILMVCTAFLVVGCSNPNEGGDLNITFFYGGYGQAWANSLALKFEEETGIKVSVRPNPNLKDEIENMLANGTDNDLIFCHNISWEMAAAGANKTIVALDDLFESEVSEGVKFKDRLIPSMLDECKLKFDGSYYRVPWTNGVGGLVYNKVMFEKYNWDVPTTYQELVDLCAKIATEKRPVDPNDTLITSAKVVPFAWSSETYYWDYLTFNWWAQMQGLESFENYKNMTDGAEAFNPDGEYKFPEAFKLWHDLVAVNPSYSLPNSSGRAFMAAQMDFANGYAAMMPSAQWFESEMRDYINPEIFVPDIMETPAAPNAKTDANGNVIKVNYTVSDDSIVIPASAPNKENAKKFLLFMARDDNAQLFTEKTLGVMLPYQYDNIDGVGEKYKTDFTRNVFNINKTHQKFDVYSQHNLVLANRISLRWATDGTNLYSTAYGRYNVSTPPTASFDEYMNAFKSRYNTIKNDWDSVLSQANALFGE